MHELLGNPELVVSFAVALVLYVITTGLLIVWWDSYAVLSAVVGICAGWGAGLLLAPYEEEQKKFKAYSKMASGFITGFLVAKLDKVFEILTDKQAGLHLLDAVVERRVWIGVICFLITAIIVFVARTYWQSIDLEEEEGK